MKCFIDANVFIRIITNDDPLKAKRCLEYLKNSIDKGQKLFIASITAAEIIWVLKSFYKLNAKSIHKKIAELLKTRNLIVLTSPNGKTILAATKISSEKNISFVDCYQYLIMKQNGIKNIISYDNDFKKLTDIKIIQP